MKRKFKAWVEHTLIIIAIILFILLMSLDDFELAALPFILLAWFIFGVIVLILKKYGKGRINE